MKIRSCTIRQKLSGFTNEAITVSIYYSSPESPLGVGSVAKGVEYLFDRHNATRPKITINVN